MIKNNYNCTQAELYAVARTGWKSYDEQLAFFGAYRGYYDAAYGTAALGEVEAAASLQDDQARYAQTEVLRIQASGKAAECLANWQTLKRYISTSYPEAEVKPRLEEAGGVRYEKAANQNWDELIQMNTQAIQFLGIHAAELQAGNNMPATFVAKYTTAADEVKVLVQDFINSEELGKESTSEKITRNNALYAKLIQMFKDGQEIFRGNEAVRDQFVFETVLGLISGAGTAGLRGIVRDSNGMPLIGVMMSVAGKTINATTDNEGKYKLTPMASGDYIVTAVKAGYTSVEQVKTVEVGVVSTLDFVMDVMP